jgi:hypothetical protein
VSAAILSSGSCQSSTFRCSSRKHSRVPFDTHSRTKHISSLPQQAPTKLTCVMLSTQTSHFQRIVSVPLTMFGCLIEAVRRIYRPQIHSRRNTKKKITQEAYFFSEWLHRVRIYF